MSDLLAVTVPLAQIRRIRIYLNPRGKSLTQILRETGADYGLNGTLYNMRTLAVNCHLRADGDVIAKPPYTVAGYAWEEGPDIRMDMLPDSAVMLDSGGSSQCDFQGQRITSSRRVQHYILVYLNDNKPEGGKPMVEINAYSKAKDGSKRLSSNFKVSEFACGDGSDAVLVAPRLVMVLQSIRSHFGAAVTIHSAYRTPQYNAKVGGVAHSQHCYGTAADIVVRGKTPAQVAAYAREIMPDWGGVGIYATKGFTHIDVREDRADWTG